MTMPPKDVDATTVHVQPEETNFQIMLGTTDDGKVRLDLYTIIGHLMFVIPPDMARGVGAGFMAEADLAELKLNKIIVPDWEPPKGFGL